MQKSNRLFRSLGKSSWLTKVTGYVMSTEDKKIASLLDSYFEKEFLEQSTVSTNRLIDEDFHHNQKEFGYCVEFLRDFRDKYQFERYIYLSVESNYAENTLLSWNGESVEMSDTVQKSLNKIDIVFLNRNCLLNTIRIQNNTISFETHNGQYSLIFCFDDIIQSYIVIDAAANQIFDFKEIVPHWYHKVPNELSYSQ
jgi:hypothetical protein